ncbi:class I SAM-dependent methyltransferase [Phenylobacterium sp.]|uniref:class I SAM-dependent methyltransferase n=1 Tax=Phenylobacterium sp. TaxID=1871053 RepID=UPI0025DDB110|nr:class I SAM-dependent methyltransferase [Phenylobacterium sp.]
MPQAANLPPWAAAVFRSDLAEAGRTASGAPIWRIADDTSQATISDQFRANAGDYHARYSASDHFQRLFETALAVTSTRIKPAPVVLDLGSGSGVNSVVPCLRLFGGARIVATDLSPELLAILAENLDHLQARERVTCVVMDAMGDHVRPGRFDLVTGASILHHLLQPQLGLAAAARALRPGGKAIFFEPFDGYSLVRLAYQRILAEAPQHPDAPLDPAVSGVFKALVTDIAARTEPDPTGPNFPYMDDKWLFAREWIETEARRLGFSSVEFVAHNDGQHLYRAVTQVQIRLATGSEALTVPDWALAILDEFDQAVPPTIKRRMMLEATIVLTRGPTPPIWRRALRRARRELTKRLQPVVQ